MRLRSACKHLFVINHVRCSRETLRFREGLLADFDVALFDVPGDDVGAVVDGAHAAGAVFSARNSRRAAGLQHLTERTLGDVVERSVAARRSTACTKKPPTPLPCASGATAKGPK